MGIRRDIQDLTDTFRTGRRVRWTRYETDNTGVVVFWPEEQSGYASWVTVLFDGQPMPISVRASELEDA